MILQLGISLLIHLVVILIDSIVSFNKKLINKIVKR